jgi:putative nucleotidyltransferase with HDIG domain
LKSYLTDFFHRVLTRKIYRFGLILFVSIFSFGVLVLPIALRPSAFPLGLGGVSTHDIVAPRTITFESKVSTDLAKKEAANAISNRYLAADPNLIRTQIVNLQSVLAYISNIRSDITLSRDQKTNKLISNVSLPISEQTAIEILSLSDENWLVVSQEAMSTLEQVIRKTIRDYQVNEVKNSLSSIVSLSLPENQSLLVQQIVDPFIVANSLYSEEATLLAKQKAIDEVEPITRTFVENQTIIFRGQIVSDEQFEVLQIYGLIKPESKSQDLLSASSIVVTLTCFIVLYFSRRKISPIDDLRSLTVISIAFAIFLLGAKFLIPNRSIIPYFYPLPAFALILVTLFNLEIGIIFSLALSVLSAFGLTNSLDLTIYYLITSLFAALTLGKGKSVSNYFTSALIIGFAGSAVLVAYRITDPLFDLIGLITLIGVAFLNGIASASLALLSQYLLSQWLGLPTPLHLLDISRMDHPLLKDLLQKAPGTYQHSLQVSNLAEQAAEAIGANALLTRVGTIYHDVGKITNASFFVENQIPGKINSHEDLDEVIAAQTIIQHVADGITLADKFRLPNRIKDFIREHHGTQITRYQYTRALLRVDNDATKVDSSRFKYLGPKPRSKETALLMLADGCEARARAELPKNYEEIAILINRVFDRCLQEGQLEESNLTLKDITQIKTSFITTLNNAYHPRIQYPDQPSEESIDPNPTGDSTNN